MLQPTVMHLWWPKLQVVSRRHTRPSINIWWHISWKLCQKILYHQFSFNWTWWLNMGQVSNHSWDFGPQSLVKPFSSCYNITDMPDTKGRQLHTDTQKKEKSIPVVYGPCIFAKTSLVEMHEHAICISYDGLLEISDAKVSKYVGGWCGLSTRTAQRVAHRCSDWHLS